MFLEKGDDSQWIDDDDITSQRSSVSTLESILRRGMRDTDVERKERTLATETENTIDQSLNSPAKRSFGSSRRRRYGRRRRYKGKSHQKSRHHSYDFDSTEEEREPILDIFGKGTGNNFKRETQTDSNSTSTSESTESLNSSESSGNSSTESESSTSSESSDSTSSDDNQATNTTTVERAFFGKGKKKGGPKNHGLKRASFSRMWRRGESTDTTAVERAFFGKSKKKGGPKNHGLKRASFSRMWRRGESTDSNSTSTSESTESLDSSESSGNSSTESESSTRGESSDSTSSDDNQATNTTTVERAFFGKSKKKGGPKNHGLKRASFSRMWRRGESTDTTAVERAFFGKSKKKGGPKNHGLKRASFSKMWRRRESTDSNSTSTSESTESLNSSESSGNSSTESESSTSSESSDSTSSDDNQATNTTTVERAFFGKSKKKGGPKNHGLKRASFSRMWRRRESTDSNSTSTSESTESLDSSESSGNSSTESESSTSSESSESISSDDNQATNTTTIERDLSREGRRKNYRKGKHRDRYSGSESDEYSRDVDEQMKVSSESSESISSDDNQATNTSAVERDLLREGIRRRYRKENPRGRERFSSRDLDEYFQGMKRKRKEGSERKLPTHRRYEKESRKRTPAENWDSPSNIDSLSDSNLLSKRFENFKGFDVLKRAVHLLLQDDLNSKREESDSEGEDTGGAFVIERMSDLGLNDLEEELKQLERREDEWFDAEEEKFYTATEGSSDSDNVKDKRKEKVVREKDARTKLDQAGRRNMDPNDSATDSDSTEDEGYESNDDVDERTPSTFKLYKKKLESNHKWNSHNNIKRDTNEETKDELSNLQKEIDEVEQNRENILEQDKMKRNALNNFRAEIKRKRDGQSTGTESEDSESDLKEDIENVINTDANDFDDFKSDIDAAADVEKAVDEVIEENAKRNVNEQTSDSAVEKEIEDVNEISKETFEDDEDNATREDPETETENTDSQATELDVSEIEDEINELEEDLEKDIESDEGRWSESSDVDDGGADETKGGEYHAAFMNSRPKVDNTKDK